jgi:hypothetical protein
VSPAYVASSDGGHHRRTDDRDEFGGRLVGRRLKVIPYGDTALSGHGHTYTPNTTPLYDFTDDDYIAATAKTRSRSSARIRRTATTNSSSNSKTARTTTTPTSPKRRTTKTF